MPKEFLMRGKTISGGTEVLEFGNQARPGYGYQLRELVLYPSAALGTDQHELVGSITASTVAVNPVEPDFNSDGLIATAYYQATANKDSSPGGYTVLNDLFVITQDLHLMVQDIGGNNHPINWQCRFDEVKLSGGAEAVANFKQYTIYNTSS
jgi:hypothetical protein